jgi:hypothetical protein
MMFDLRLTNMIVIFAVSSNAIYTRFFNQPVTSYD